MTTARDVKLVADQLGCTGIWSEALFVRFEFPDGSHIAVTTIDTPAWRGLVDLAKRAAGAHACAVCGQPWPCAEHHDSWFAPRP
jgi:hypothetical protein